MRPFRERVVIVLWVLWAILCSASVLGVIGSYWIAKTAKGETISSYNPVQLNEAISRAEKKGEMNDARILSAQKRRQDAGSEIPQSVVDAYQTRKMNSERKFRF